MDSEKAAEELKVLRQLMERPIRFSTMSGLSGVLAGLAAIAGCLIDGRLAGACPACDPVLIHMLVWAGVFVAAFAAAMVLTRLREIRQGMPAWSKIKRRILITILPPFFIAAGLTVIDVIGAAGQQSTGQWGIIPAMWMAFYGLALWQVGEFSPVEVRLLGAAFMAGALAAAIWARQEPYLAMGLSFGGLHIVYGLIVWIRHGG